MTVVLIDQSVDPLSDEGGGEAGRPGQAVRLRGGAYGTAARPHVRPMPASNAE